MTKLISFVDDNKKDIRRREIMQINSENIYEQLENKSIVIRQISRQSGIKDIDEEGIRKRASKGKHNLYFKNDYTPVEEYNEQYVASYRWISTGYKNTQQEDLYICISESNLLKARVGTEISLLKEVGIEKKVSVIPEIKMESIQQEKEVWRKTAEEQSSSTIDNHVNEPVQEPQKMETELVTKKSSNNIGDIFMVNPIMLDSWKTENQDVLKAYLTTLCTHAMQGNVKNVVYSQDKKTYMINSGLLDNFGRHIYITYNVDSNKKIGNIRKVTSKNELLSMGFAMHDAQCKLDPVTVWNTRDELKWKGSSIHEFDLENNSAMDAIIKNIQTKYSDFTSEEIYQRIEFSISTALKITQCDERYIVPGYSPADKSLFFLIPLHITADIEGKPAFVLAVNRTSENEFYTIKQVISPEIAYAWAKNVNPYLNHWLY